MSLTTTRSERLFFTGANLNPTSFATEIVSKSVINPTVESDKASNDDVNGIGRGRSYVSRLKGTIEYETPFNIELIADMMTAQLGEESTRATLQSTVGSDWHGVTASTILNTTDQFTKLTVPADYLNQDDVAHLNYLYTNSQHSLRLNDALATYKIMAESGNSGSVVRLGVSAMGNLSATPYGTPVIPATVSTPNSDTSYFPTSGISAWLIDGVDTTAHEITGLSGLTIDFGYEIAHNAVLGTDADSTGYAEPTLTKCMPMVELTRLYTNDTALNTFINTVAEGNRVDTRLGLLVQFTNSDGGVVFVWIPRININEPSYGDDSDVKTQSLTIEQQNRHNSVTDDNDVFTIYRTSNTNSIVVGASGEVTEEDSE